MPRPYPGTRAQVPSAQVSPRTSRPIRGPATRRAAAALRRRLRVWRADARRSAGRRRRCAATRNATNKREPDDAGMGEEPHLEAVRPAGFLVGPPPANVVVGEVVLSEAADRVRRERLQRDPPEVVAPAADDGEMRASGGAAGLMAEAVPLTLDEAERVAVRRRDRPAGRDAQNEHGDGDADDPAASGARCSGTRASESTHAISVPSTNTAAQISSDACPALDAA